MVQWPPLNPADPAVKILCFHCRGYGFNPWWGTKISHAAQHVPSPKKEKKMEKSFADHPVQPPTDWFI